MWEEFDMEIDPAFLERDRCRKAGKAVEIRRTERLVIRETVLEDVPELYRIWRLPGMGDYIQPMQPTLDEELEFMEGYIRHGYPFYDYGLWTVLDGQQDHVVGRAGLFPSELLDDAVELGYMIAPAYQGQGLATECGKAILAYAREVLELTDIHLLTDPENQASVRVAEKLGFEKAGGLYKSNRKLLHYIWRVNE